MNDFLVDNDPSDKLCFINALTFLFDDLNIINISYQFTVPFFYN